MPATETAPGFPEIARIVASNPGPMTLAGTNSYVVGRDPAWVIDPGPAEADHIEALRAEGERRGGIAGVLITHGHGDHNAGVKLLGVEVVWGTGEPLAEEQALRTAMAEPQIRAVGAGVVRPPVTVGPFTVIPTPGHAVDHAAIVFGEVCFCGDLVLGEGSSIVPPQAGGGSLADYMSSLDRVAELNAALLGPGHGPWIRDPAAKLREYRDHRLARERALRAALGAGERSKQRLLEAAWGDVPPMMRPAAALAMRAHLEKLAGEGVGLGELID